MEKLFLSSFGIISAHFAAAAEQDPAFPVAGWDFFTQGESVPQGKHIYLENSMVIHLLEENGKELLELGWGMKSVAEPLTHGACMYGKRGSINNAANAQ